MNKLFLVIATAFVLLFISACTANSNQSNEEDSLPEIVEVEIQIPGEITSKQENILKVKVTQGQENVDNADDVQFEIWKANNKEDSEMIEAQYEKDGIFSVKKTFQEDGIYYVQTHVTAKGLHVMPKKRLIVGNVSEEELNSLQKEQQNQGGSNSHSNHH